MKSNTKISKKQIAVLTFVAIVTAGAVFIPIMTSASGPAVNQGTTSTYGVLAATTVTNTGTTTISGSAGGDIGLSPGTSYTGNTTVTRSGVDHITDAAAEIAQADLVTAYNDASAPSATTLTAEDLAGQTIVAGTYSTVAGTFSNSGTLTLDAQGDSTAVFIFQATSTVINSVGSNMVLANGAQACNVYWRVGSSATIETNSTFVGHIYASESITAKAGSMIYGQLLARNGAVTLDTATIVNNSCVTPAPPAPAAPQAAPRVAVPVIPQSSEITGVNSAVCTTNSGYTAYVIGRFPTEVANIAVNGTNIAVSRWIQTANQIAITIPASEVKSFTIDIFNGLTPLLPTQVFLCTEEIFVPQAPTPEAIPTETGGLLPVTSSNQSNYLLIGGGLVVLGGAIYLLRRRSIRL